MNGVREGSPEDVGGIETRRWSFGSVVLDERTLELRVVGKIVPLERKPLEVLMYLLLHANEVVTKDELAKNLWPGRIPSENVVARCISMLRDALKADRAAIRTIHGFGYRLIADVKVEASSAPAPPKLNFNPGDTPPLRAHWRLAERLGSGGHGEAWLAVHEKTGERRVFKFALDDRALASLKREITLYRVLNDGLGGRAAVVRILDWNLEEAPYFTEAEYVEGRDLRSWAAARGGLERVPLQQRLDFVAQVADALADAHGVGVLHKDLNPGNVLVQLDEQGASLRLCDFGSGGVMDPGRLEALGITRLGFTRTIANEPLSATPLYVAPEVISGQPVTVKSDIYALGVLLYQMVVGNFQKPLAPGWELDVADELLQKDIAASAAGDPDRRVGDAAEISHRLRSLEQRRAVLAEEAEAQQRAGRMRDALNKARRARTVALVSVLLLMAAATGGVVAYRERNDAVRAATSARNISDFLTEDVLTVDPALERPADTSYQALLERAAAQVDNRFSAQPDDAATIHWLLGRRFQDIGQTEKALTEYESAARLFSSSQKPDAQAALLVMNRLAPLYLDRGRKDEAISLSEALLRKWLQHYSERSLETLLIRTRVARLRSFAGDFNGAAKELEDVMADVAQSEPPTAETRDILGQEFGITLATDLSRIKSDGSMKELIWAHANAVLGACRIEFEDNYIDGVHRLEESLGILTKILGRHSEPVASVLSGLGYAIGLQGRYPEGERMLTEARRFYQSWLPPTHGIHPVQYILLARLKLEQLQPAPARGLLQSAVKLCTPGNCSPRVREELRLDMATADWQLGELSLAESLLRKTLIEYEHLQGKDHVGSLRRRVALADLLLQEGKRQEAEQTLQSISAQALSRLPPDHKVIADFYLVRGLLHPERAQEAYEFLRKAQAINRSRYGDKHWRTQRVTKEMLRLNPAPSEPRALNAST